MPLYHCNNCMHEFEGYPRKKTLFSGLENPKCDWCGAGSYILDHTTPLEQMMKSYKQIIKMLVEKGNKESDVRS